MIYQDSNEFAHQSFTDGMNIQDTPKSSKLVNDTMSLKEIKGTPPCSPPRLYGSNSLGHNRSVSHDSYFDQLADQEDLGASPILRPSQEGLHIVYMFYLFVILTCYFIDLSDLQVNFDLDESDMRVFSDEDTNNIFSNRSSMEHIQNVTTNNVSLILIIT